MRFGGNFLNWWLYRALEANSNSPAPPAPPQDNEMIQATDNVPYSSINAGNVTIISPQASNYSLRDLILTVNTPFANSANGNIYVRTASDSAGLVLQVPMTSLSSQRVLRIGGTSSAFWPITYFNGVINASDTLILYTDATLTAGNISCTAVFILL